MRRAVPFALVLAALSAAPRPARAQPQPLKYDLRVDGAILVGTWALYGGLELWKDDLAPMKCKFCEPNSFDAWARERLVWGNINQAQAASSALAFIVVPAGMAAHQLLAARSAGDVNAGWVDILIVAEATGIAMDVNQIAKFTTGRQRPFVHYGNYGDPNRAPNSDDNLSFPGGHSTFTFAIATAAGTVSSMRGYKSAPWVWGIGLTLAAATGYLRVAGDMHYLTDVLVGAGTGIAAGVAIPLLMHPREDANSGSGKTSLTLSPIPLGIAGVF